MKRALNIGLLALVLVCGVSWWVGHGSRLPWWGEEPTAALPPSGRVLPFSGKAVATDASGIQVVVLNGTHVQGLARDCGMLLGYCGLAPIGFGNAKPQNYPRCFLVNRRLNSGQLEVLRLLLGGLPVLQEFDDRRTEDAVLVLGADHLRLLENLKARLP